MLYPDRKATEYHDCTMESRLTEVRELLPDRGEGPGAGMG